MVRFQVRIIIKPEASTTVRGGLSWEKEVRSYAVVTIIEVRNNLM